MKQYLGPTIGFAIIALLIANAVYLHIVLREIRKDPASHHDWAQIINDFRANQ